MVPWNVMPPTAGSCRVAKTAASPTALTCQAFQASNANLETPASKYWQTQMNADTNVGIPRLESPNCHLHCMIRDRIPCI